MSITRQVDHIIVGQGLAGSCLALQLLKQGKKILVFDEPQNNRASAVAAGLFNPITGRFLKHTWSAEQIFPALFQFYTEAERLLRQRFFHPMPIYRPFTSVEEQNEWMAGSDDHQLKNFIDRINTSSAFDQVHDPFGGVLTRQSGYLDTEIFMQAVTEFLRSKDAYQTLHFEATKMKIREDHIDYDDVACASVIFCDGLGNKANHFFGWVPVRPLKGETLTVSLPEQLEVVFNRGVYIVPTNVEQTYKVGATYNPRDVSGEITASARQEMEIKLSDLIKIPYRINHQNWGMRPTTPDRRPILGQHPEFKNLIIFTGLGTKGVSLAPYFSALLATWLAGQAEIPSEVNIARFKSLYSRFSSATV